MFKRSGFFICMFLWVFINPSVINAVDESIEKAQLSLAEKLFSSSRYSEAIVEFERLLFDMNTETYADDCRYFLGTSHLSLREFGKAEENFSLVVTEYSESVFHGPSLYLLGRSLYLQKQYSDAIQVFDSYVERYTHHDYADNSIYWKGEAFLGMNDRVSAKNAFEEVLRRYPQGNKADAARFKLRVLELEEKLEEQKKVESVPEPEGLDGEAESTRLLREENKKLRQREAELLAEIEALQNTIDQLNTELQTLRALGKGTQEEREQQLQEKVQALAFRENLLRIKQEALSQKEIELKKLYENLREISAKFMNGQ
jgi:predicted negative regulator of RcsB-dependent stress response